MIDSMQLNKDVLDSADREFNGISILIYISSAVAQIQEKIASEKVL